MSWTQARAALAIAGVSAGLVAGGIGSTAAVASGDKDCSDFNTQKQAQHWFKKHGGSKHNNVANLDSDGDGKACEDLP